MSSNFWFSMLALVHTKLQGINVPMTNYIINWYFFTIQSFEWHLARAIASRRRTLVHQKTNDHTSDVVRTTSLICFFHQPLCCFLGIFNWFNHSNSFLEKEEKIELELDKISSQGLALQFFKLHVMTCLNGLVRVYLLAYALMTLFGRAYRNNLWLVHKLYSSYVQKLSRIDYENKL